MPKMPIATQGVRAGGDVKDAAAIKISSKDVRTLAHNAFRTLCQFWFAFCLMFLYLPMAFFMTVVHLIPSRVLALSTKQSICRNMFPIAFRALLLLNPQIKVQIDDSVKDCLKELKALSYHLEDSGEKQVVYCISNHISFLDGFIKPHVLGHTVYSRSTSLVDGAFATAPILSIFTECCNTIPVILRPGEPWNGFALDKLEMKKHLQNFDDHLESGGWVTYAPEGSVTQYRKRKEPVQNGVYPNYENAIDRDEITKVLPFRWGGIERARQHKAVFYAVTFVGNQVVWPRWAAMGGFPGKVTVRMKKIEVDYDALPNKKTLAIFVREKMEEALSEQFEAYDQKKAVYAELDRYEEKLLPGKRDQ